MFGWILIIGSISALVILVFKKSEDDDRDDY